MTNFRVTDLKQYSYCPRIIYYYYCLPDIRPITYKMEAGQAAQGEEETREARRSLRVYGLRRGVVHHNVYLESERLGLRGQVDVVIETDDNRKGEPELIPVDYKLSTARLGPHFKLQLAAYGQMLAETQDIPVRRGFLYAIPRRKAVEVPFTSALLAELARAVQEMADIAGSERMPAPVKQRAKCEVCEFRRFCNDV